MRRALALSPRDRSAEQVLHLHADRVDPQPPLRPILHFLRPDRQRPLLHSRRQDADVPAAHNLRQPAAEQRLLRPVHGEHTTACRRRISLRSRLTQRFPLCSSQNNTGEPNWPKAYLTPVDLPDVILNGVARCECLRSSSGKPRRLAAFVSAHHRANLADVCLSRVLGRAQTKRTSTTTRASSRRQRRGRCPPSHGSCRRLR